MEIGTLNRRALIERKRITQDATYGTEVVTWTTVATVWCEVQDVLPARAFEYNKAGMGVSVNLSRVRMRYRTDVDSAMRLTIGRPTATVCQIVSGPAELGNRDGIELIVERYSS